MRKLSYNRNLLTFIYTEMATKRQEEYDDEEIARRLYLDEIEEQRNEEERDNEEIRKHNEIAERNYQEELYKKKEHLKRVKNELRKQEKYYLMEIQNHIILMLDLNLRFNDAQTFDEKCKERSQPVGTDSSRHNIIISTPNTNQWSLFIVTLQTTLMDRQSAHLMTRVQRLLTCAVTDYYTTPSSRRSVSIGWSSCSLGIPVLYFCRLISMGSLIFCRFFMW